MTAIRNGHAAPKGYVSADERQRREEARQARQHAEAERQRQEREQIARERAEKKAVAAYWDALTPEQQAELDDDAIAQADAEERKLIEPGPMQRIGLGILRDKHIRHLLRIREKQPVEA